MNNKFFIARTKSALKSRAQVANLDLNNYVIFKITDKARNNASLKSLSENITDKNFKYLMVLKDFVVLTTEGTLRINAGALAENSYAAELNDPEHEVVGDKFVVDGVVKGIYDKVVKASDFSDSEKITLLKALKSWGEHDADTVSTQDEFVDELGETKSQHSDEEDDDGEETKGMYGNENDEEMKTIHAKDDDEKEPDDKKETKGMHAEKEDEEEMKSMHEDKEDEEDDEETKGMHGQKEDEEDEVTKSMRQRISAMSTASIKDLLFASLKSYGSVAEDSPVFQNKNQAQKFAQSYNTKAHGVSRAEVTSADRHVRRRYGSRAKFIVTFTK